MQTVKTFLGLGSNLGDAQTTFRAALDLLAERGAAQVISVSSLYGSKPYGVTDQPDFTNAVVEAETRLTALALLRECKAIEAVLGRQPTVRWGPRLIDIDLLLYDDVNIVDPELTVPHPGLMLRPFVLVPLAEIAPDLILPSGVSAAEAAGAMGSEGLWVVEGRKWHQ